MSRAGFWVYMALITVTLLLVTVAAAVWNPVIAGMIAAGQVVLTATWAVGEVRRQGQGVLIYGDTNQPMSREWAEAFLEEWRRPYFGPDQHDALIAVSRAATVANQRNRHE